MPAICTQLGARNSINLHHKVHVKPLPFPVFKQPWASRLASKIIPSKIHNATQASSNGASSSEDSTTASPSSATADEPKGDLDLLIDLMSADDEGAEALEKMVEVNRELLQNQFFQNCADAMPMLEEKFGPAAGEKVRSVLTKVMECQMALSPPDYQLVNRLSLLETSEQRIELLDSLDQGTLVDVLKLENYRFFKLIDDMIIDLDKRRDPNAEIFVERARNSRELAFARLPKELQDEIDNKAWLEQKADIDLLFKLLGAEEVEQFDQVYEAVLKEQGESRFSDKFFANCMQMVQVIPENDAIMAEKMKKLVEKIFNLQFAKMPLDYQLINVLTMAETKEERKNILDNMEDNVLKMTLSMERFRFFALLDETEKDLERNAGAGLLNEDEMALKLEKLRDSRRQAYERLSAEEKSQVATPA
ncbi:hypothetical protein NADE_007909 [Nannochloris sp. 'desiccata']|nr:hypothetical protein NADE_007909 [Chlorella desiccata (nom. nud.)]